MDLLHDLPVDPVSHAEQPVAIDPVNGRRQRRGDARRSGVDPPDRSAWPGTDERDRAPGAATPPHRSDQHVALNRRMGVTDVARQARRDPSRSALGSVKSRSASGRPARSVAMPAVSRLKELARVAQRMAERLVRLADVRQMRGQAVDGT